MKLMRALHTRSHPPLLRSGYLTERNSGEPPRLQRGGHRVSILAGSDADDRLDSWKEIALHLKRTVRTVQRWEKHEGLPIHRHLHQRANSVYARRSELDEWWNREAHSIRVAPIQANSEGSPSEVTDSQALTPINPEGEGREAGPTGPTLLVECVLEPQAAGTCSPSDRAGHLIPVLRVRIHIPDYLPAPEAGSATKGAKAPCRSLSLAASRWSPYPVDSRDEHGKYIL